jgi:hypothetical protein
MCSNNSHLDLVTLLAGMPVLVCAIVLTVLVVAEFSAGHCSGLV